MLTHSPRAFPLGDSSLPWAPVTVQAKHRRLARGRRPRPRICLRKGCGRKYQPRRWNQRYCQDPECLRQVRRWQAARRQAKRRQDAERQSPACPGREGAPPASQVRAQGRSEPRSYAGAWSRSRKFFSLPLCDRPGCHEPPVTSLRNPARYCCPACRQAVRNVQDRERKWLSRGTLDGRKKRAIEYQAARRHRSPRRRNTAAQRRRGHLRSDDSSRLRRSSIIACAPAGWFSLGMLCSLSGAQA